MENWKNMRETRKKKVKFQKELRKLRTEKNMTLRELQKATGISYVTLSRYEHGLYSNPGRQNIHLLAKTFGVTRAYLEDLLE